MDSIRKEVDSMSTEQLKEIAYKFLVSKEKTRIRVKKHRKNKKGGATVNGEAKKSSN